MSKSLSKDDSTISTPRSSKKRSWNMKVRFCDDSEEQQGDHSDSSVSEQKPRLLFAEAINGPSISLADPLLATKPKTLRPSSPEIVIIEAEDYRPTTSMQSSLDVTDDTIPSSSADRPSSVIGANAKKAHREAEIASYLKFGSEEESDDGEDMPAWTSLSKENRFMVIDEHDLEDEPAVNTYLFLQWPPPPPAAHLPAPPSSPPSSPPRSPPPSPPAVGDIFSGPVSKFNFEWRAFPQPQIEPDLRRETFNNINCGCTAEFSSPYEAFTAIWTPEIIALIVAETNRYALQQTATMIETGSLFPKSRLNHWKDVDADELFVFFAIIQGMGVVTKTRIEEYWSKSKGFLSTPGFGATMSIDRFLLLGKSLHFRNNEECDPTRMTRAQGKLFKIQPIIDHLNLKFSTLYNMTQNIALDESLTQWKGRLDINQFIRNKAASIGIKTYEVCESATGYLWRFEVHAGHEALAAESGPVSGIVPALVLRLLEGLEHKGYTVFMDNFYNSPALARELKTRGIDCVGTLRLNRQFVPVEMGQLTKENMTLGQVSGCTSGDVDIVVWRDKIRVAVLSTYHGLATVNCAGTLKPSIIPDYNVCMGGVDRKDQMLAMYPIERRRTKIWYKKFFRRLMNASILNSFILFTSRRINSLSHRTFRITLIDEIISRHKPPVVPRPLPINGDHFPGSYENAGGNPGVKKQKNRRLCAVCKKRTSVYCIACQVPLCVFTCFKPYHRQ